MLMKLGLITFLLLTASFAQAEPICDVRVGQSVGVNVVEFASGKQVHSKMALKDTSPKAIAEEMANLQDMGVCAEKIITKKCVLKLEKKAVSGYITMFRGNDRWISWSLGSKGEAQNFVKNLQKIGFCS
jgi:hypothetical protein